MAKILIVDENPADVRQISSVLIPRGHQLLAAQSVMAARRRLISRASADMVITEMNFSKGCGLDLLNYIGRTSPLRYLPVVVCSEAGNRESIVNVLNSGARDFILKPIDETILAEKVEHTLNCGRPEVLVVDDEPFMLDLLQKVLEREGFTVHTAGSAEDGLEIVNTRNIKVVVTDIRLPGMSGIDLLSKVKSLNPELPVLMITGLPGEFSVDKAQSLGADGYITKPFKNVEIAGLLLSWMGRAPWTARPEKAPEHH